MTPAILMWLMLVLRGEPPQPMIRVCFQHHRGGDISCSKWVDAGLYDLDRLKKIKRLQRGFFPAPWRAWMELDPGVEKGGAK